jgi:large subunit ribosomal protein L6
MSRIGNKPIPVPNGVEISLNGQDIKVKGGKGIFSLSAYSLMKIK